MTALADTDVTLTKVRKHRVGMLRHMIYDITYGNAALTTPATGVPLPALAGFGGLKTLEDWGSPNPTSPNGYVYKYDPTNHSIRIYQSAGHTHDLKYIGGITATEPVAIAGGDTLGKNAATDRTIAGADSTTKGGVVALAAAEMAHVPTTHAPAATTLRLSFWGR